MKIYFANSSVQDQKMMDEIKEIHNTAIVKLSLKNFSEDQHTAMRTHPLQIILNPRLKTKGGSASFNRLTRKFTIEINYNLHRANLQELKDTYLHELGHVLDYYFFDSSDHGYRWKAITSSLGGSISRTHKMDTSAFKKKQTRYNYSCGCRSHSVSAIKHNKIQRGAAYICNLCKKRIQAVEQCIQS